MAISKTILQYRTLADLQEYAEAQNTTILNLSSKLKKLEDERDHLKTLLQNNAIVIQNKEVVDITSNDSEYICQVEIAKLKRITSERELTIEESRRFDTYYKILNNINSKETKVEKDVKEIETKELLQIVKSDADAKRSKS